MTNSTFCFVCGLYCGVIFSLFVAVLFHKFGYISVGY